MTPEIGPRAGPIRWRASAGLALGAGGLAVVVAFLLPAPTALLFAVPLLLAPLAAAFARPPEGAYVELRGRPYSAAHRRWLSVEVRTVPPARGLLRLRVPPMGTADPDQAPPVVIPLDEAGRGSGAVPLGGDLPAYVAVTFPTVRWGDALGLAEMDLPGVGGPIVVDAAPAGARQVSALLVRRTATQLGPRRATLPASEGEFQAVRPYLPGDGVRQINWPASARWGRLLTNTFRAELAPEVVLALDVGPWDLPPDDAEALLGVERAAARALAKHLLRERARIGAAILEPFPRFTPLGSGRSHLERVLLAIGGATLGAERPPPARYAISLARVFPPRSTVLLFSPLLDPGMQAVGYHLRRAGLFAFVVAPSPTTLDAARIDPSRAADVLGLRLGRLGRSRAIAEAWQWAPSVEWESFDSMAAFTLLFRRPQLARSGVRG